MLNFENKDKAIDSTKIDFNDIKKLVIKYFPSFSELEVDQFLSISEYLVFENKDIVLKSGRIDNNFFLILSGSARAYVVDANGCERNHHMRSDGYIFGDPRAFGNENEKRILDIEAIGELHILMFSLDDLEALAHKNPVILSFYIKFLKEVIIVFGHRIHTFVAMSAKERYEDLLRWDPIYLKTTFDKNIASFIGVRPLTLHRIKKQKE